MYPQEDDYQTTKMDSYVVADEAFGLSNCILTPYARKNITYVKKIFNYRHTRSRRFVECTFGILGNKWRIFHRLIDVGIDFAISIIKTCILHNHVREKNGITFVDTLNQNQLDDITVVNDTRGMNHIGGINMRQYLTSYFVSPQGSVPFHYDKV